MTRLRRKPRQQRSIASWHAVLDAAAQLFGKLGYARTTTNKVAERAGVSIGTLYQYFPNKDALLLALADRHMAEAGAGLERAFALLSQQQPDLEQTLEVLIDAVVALHRHDPAMHRLLVDLAPRTPEAVARLRHLEQAATEAVEAQLRRLGVGGRSPRSRAMLIVQGIEAQVHGAVLDPQEGVSTEELVAEIKLLWLGALRAETATGSAGRRAAPPPTSQ